MTPEERFERIERQLEFVAANQANHDARLAENSRLLGEGSRLLAENTGQIGQLTDLTLRIGHVVEEQARQLDGLAGRMDELAASQKRTDERLSTLIDVIERYFSDTP